MYAQVLRDARSGLKEINIYIGESEKKSVFCEMYMFWENIVSWVPFANVALI